jgi:hypothetical protein
MGSVDGVRPAAAAGGAYGAGAATGAADTTGPADATGGVERRAEGATDGAERGATGADGANDGARGAIGAAPEREEITPVFGASLMRLVAGAGAGAALVGAATAARWTTGALLASVSPSSARPTGAFAAGATPDIVLRMSERALAPGRGIRDPISAPCFRPSDPNAAPMRKIK